MQGKLKKFFELSGTIGGDAKTHVSYTCTFTMLHVHVQCYMYMYNVTCTCTMLHVHVQCYMYMYNVTCTFTMLHVHVQCSSVNVLNNYTCNLNKLFHRFFYIFTIKIRFIPLK